MWNLAVARIILCLLIFGYSTAKGPVELTGNENFKEYVSLGEEEETSLEVPEEPRVENRVPWEDEDELSEELPAVDLAEWEDEEEEEGDDDQDDQVEFMKHTRHRVKPSWRKKEQKERKWQRKYKKDDKTEKKMKPRREWRKERREHGNRMTFEAPEYAPLRKGIIKISKRLEKKADKMIRPRIFYGRQEERREEVEEEEDDDEEEEVRKGEDFPHPHGGRGHHKRGHHHKKEHHGGKHHHKGGRHHWRPHHGKHGGHRRHHRRLPMSLEKRVEFVCARLEKDRHSRFFQGVSKRLQKGVGDVEKKSYRIEFVGRMRQCCNNSASERVECFVTLTRQRHDNFCDRNMPIKPWAPTTRKLHMKTELLNRTCCHLTGQERYDCFNKTMEMWQQDPTEDSVEETETEEEETVGVEPSSAEVEELLDEEEEEEGEEGEEEDDFDEDEEEEEEEDLLHNGHEFPGRRGRRPHHKHHRRGRRPFVRHVKIECCHAGKKAGTKVNKSDMRKVCMTEGAKFAKTKKIFKGMCGIFYARCCIHTANGTSDGTDEPPVGHRVIEEPMPYDVMGEDDVDDDDVSVETIMEDDSRASWKKPRYRSKDGHQRKHGKMYDQMID